MALAADEVGEAKAAERHYDLFLAKFAAGADLLVSPLVDLVSTMGQWNFHRMIRHVGDCFLQYQMGVNFELLVLVYSYTDSFVVVHQRYFWNVNLLDAYVGAFDSFHYFGDQVKRHSRFHWSEVHHPHLQ